PRLHRELPFALRVGEGPGPGLVVRGQLDALLVDGETATVIDYKLSRGSDAARYAFQLDAYALAADRLVEGAVPIRSALVFLRPPSMRAEQREDGRYSDGKEDADRGDQRAGIGG